MKIGWLVWEFENEERPTRYVDGDEPAWAYRKVRIVYAELME